MHTVREKVLYCWAAGTKVQCHLAPSLLPAQEHLFLFDYSRDKGKR